MLTTTISNLLRGNIRAYAIHVLLCFAGVHAIDATRYHYGYNPHETQDERLRNCMAIMETQTFELDEMDDFKDATKYSIVMRVYRPGQIPGFVDNIKDPEPLVLNTEVVMGRRKTDETDQFYGMSPNHLRFRYKRDGIYVLNTDIEHGTYIIPLRQDMESSWDISRMRNDKETEHLKAYQKEGKWKSKSRQITPEKNEVAGVIYKQGYPSVSNVNGFQQTNNDEGWIIFVVQNDDTRLETMMKELRLLTGTETQILHNKMAVERRLDEFKVPDHCIYDHFHIEIAEMYTKVRSYKKATQSYQRAFKYNNLFATKYREEYKTVVFKWLAEVDNENVYHDRNLKQALNQALQDRRNKMEELMLSKEFEQAYELMTECMNKIVPKQCDHKPLLRKSLEGRIHSSMALTCHFLGKYKEAVQEAKKALEANPSYYNSYTTLAVSYKELGMQSDEPGYFIRCYITCELVLEKVATKQIVIEKIMSKERARRYKNRFRRLRKESGEKLKKYIEDNHLGAEENPTDKYGYDILDLTEKYHRWIDNFDHDKYSTEEKRESNWASLEIQNYSEILSETEQEIYGETSVDGNDKDSEDFTWDNWSILSQHFPEQDNVISCIQKLMKNRSDDLGLVSGLIYDDVHEVAGAKLHAKYLEVEDLIADKQYNEAFEIVNEQIHCGESLYSKEKPVSIKDALSQLYSSVGYIYGIRRKWEDCAQAARKVIEYKPMWYKGHAMLGTVYAKQKKFDDAILCYQEALDVVTYDEKNAFKIPSIKRRMASAKKQRDRAKKHDSKPAANASTPAAKSSTEK